MPIRQLKQYGLLVLQPISCSVMIKAYIYTLSAFSLSPRSLTSGGLISVSISLCIQMATKGCHWLVVWTKGSECCTGGRRPPVCTTGFHCSWAGTRYSLTFTTEILALFWTSFLLLLKMQQYDHWSDARDTFNIFRMVEEKDVAKSHPYHILKFCCSVYSHHINLDDLQLIWLIYKKMAFV